MLRKDRRLRHENVTNKFDANRGIEGQIKTRENAKGEVELVAFFRGKWYYSPMAEFSKTLNLRHGAQVNGKDIMTSTQKDSSGFTSIRLDSTSSEMPPKLNECRFFIDTVPATPDGGSAITKNFVLNEDNKQVIATANGVNANIVAGLNVTGDDIHDGTYITAIDDAGTVSSKMKLFLSRGPSGSDINQTLTFQTRVATVQNAFLNIIYKDSSDIYYHKFQLNTTTVTPFYDTPDQNTDAGSVGGAGGSGVARGAF